jgi:hypothetical protein
MNRTVYLFFNYSARENYPAHDYWSNWSNPDTTKLAIFVEHSWAKRGWEVKRLSTVGIKGFEFTGKCVESLKLYPYDFWNFWFAAMKVCQDRGPTLFSTIDVLNNGFYPTDACYPIDKYEGSHIVSYRHNFSAATVFLDSLSCDHAITRIREYDRYESFKKLESDLVSDETILRAYGRIKCADRMSYALIEPDKDLIHCPRSVLKNYRAPDNL